MSGGDDRPAPARNHCRHDRIRIRYVPGKGWEHMQERGKRGAGFVLACSDPHPTWCTRGEHEYGECWAD